MGVYVDRILNNRTAQTIMHVSCYSSSRHFIESHLPTQQRPTVYRIYKYVTVLLPLSHCGRNREHRQIVCNLLCTLASMYGSLAITAMCMYCDRDSNPYLHFISLLSLFKKLKIRLSDHHAGCL
jgi:hypothetical protein